MKSFKQHREEGEARGEKERARTEALRDEEYASALVELLPEFTELQAAAILRAIEIMR